ncbi:MAG: hypothetical protein K8R46_01095 [Pirellulales bacterium]|nr:hypothetical protein [Pirellulales bacterium]
MSRFSFDVALGLAFWLLAGSNLSSAEKPTDPGPKLRTGQAAIEKALAEPVSLEFTETPLEKVVEFLKNRCKIEIVIDLRALSDMGIGADTPVTKKLHNLPLRSALNLILRDFYISWTIKDNVLFITTPEAEESVLCMKVYNVSDLVVCRDDQGILWDDYDTLIDAISDTVMTTSWNCLGGPGSITGASFGKAKVLIVSQRYRAHRKIAELLARIREVAEKNPDAETPRRNRPITRPEEK